MVTGDTWASSGGCLLEHWSGTIITWSGEKTLAPPMDPGLRELAEPPGLVGPALEVCFVQHETGAL